MTFSLPGSAMLRVPVDPLGKHALLLPYSRQTLLHGVHWQRPSTLIYGVITEASSWFIHCAPSIGGPLVEIFKGRQKCGYGNPAAESKVVARETAPGCLWEMFAGVQRIFCLVSTLGSRRKQLSPRNSRLCISPSPACSVMACSPPSYQKSQCYLCTLARS